jgi:hypothetical protein
MAQSSDNAPQGKPATIHERKENQQDRIANGIQSAQLTAGEAGRLEKKVEPGRARHAQAG